MRDCNIIEDWINDIAEKDRPPPLKKKIFKPKHDLPVLEDYKKSPDMTFWEKFPKNYKYPGKSQIEATELEELCKEAGVEGEMVDNVLHDIAHGADLGCVGPARNPTRSKNSASSYDFGPQVTDAVADWCAKGFCYGPITESLVPEEAKVSGIMCREKPNGSARVILNLSSPEKQSVNDGIAKDLYPAQMSSTEQWLEVMNKAGRNCNIAKTDWGDAYKHLPVRTDDLPLQYFMWLGMFFVELCLIFGCCSSVGLFDRLAKVVLAVVIALAQFPADMVCQHLDDVVAAAPDGCNSLWRFDWWYRKVAERVGITLAPREDPEKSFPPSKEGVVFGVNYNTVTWRWSLPQEKLDRIVHMIWDVMESELVEGSVIESLAGKLVHIRALIPESRFHMSAIMAAVKKVRQGAKVVQVSKRLKKQLEYWKIMLQLCNGNMVIPDYSFPPPQWGVDFHTDAAGGSIVDPWRGVGMVYEGGWSFLPWPRCVNAGKRDNQGKSLAKKLSFLEIMGALLVVSAAPEVCWNNPVRVWIDNIGAVQIWKKGYSSTCELSTTIVRATALVASRLRCRLDIKKITRCSNAPAEQADALSKGEFTRFARLWKGELPEARKFPRVLLKWLANPDPEFPLGVEICRELRLI